MTGIELVTKEREKQVEKWGNDHDDLHVDGELALSAVSYIVCYGLENYEDLSPEDATKNALVFWGFDDGEFHPSENPVRNLTKAAAMLVAEIDRLLRLPEND